jgi:4-amino-4-deoxy-L-arabinose transferase-like glycosyltransferase
MISLALSARLFQLPMVSDEGGYAYAAERWLDGRGTLYHDVWISRPQAIFLVYGAVIKVLGGSTVDLRLVAWAVNVATMIVVWAIATHWANRRVAAIATVFFGLLMSSPAIEGFTANAEVFMALPAALAVLSLTTAMDRSWSPKWLLMTGTLIGVSSQLKPSGVVMLLVVAVFLALIAADSSKFVRQVAGRFGLVVAGFAGSMVPAIIHGISVGWDEFIYASVTYRITRQSSATSSLDHHLNAIWDLTARVWPIYVAICLVCGARYCAGLERRIQIPRSFAPRPALGVQPALGISPRLLSIDMSDPTRRLLQIWLIGCLFGISMGGDWWYHYLIQIAAPLAIWMAISIDRVRPRVPVWAPRVLVGAVAVMLLVPYLVVTRPTRAEMTSELFGHPGYADQEAVAKYLRENTDPETPIFIAFDQAALYYLADRPSTYRYLYDQELRAYPDSEAALVAMVESDERPMYIVGTRQLAPFADRGLAFWEAVQRHYVLETTVRGVPIYRAIESGSAP